MVELSFASSFRRHIDCPTSHFAGGCVRDVFEAAFADRQVLRGYVLDDQGAVRHHVAVFVDGERLRDTARQSDPVRPDSVIHVMQALSGG